MSANCHENFENCHGDYFENRSRDVESPVAREYASNFNFGQKSASMMLSNSFSLHFLSYSDHYFLVRAFVDRLVIVKYSIFFVQLSLTYEEFYLSMLYI